MPSLSEEHEMIKAQIDKHKNTGISMHIGISYYGTWHEMQHVSLPAVMPVGPGDPCWTPKSNENSFVLAVTCTSCSC